MDDPRESPFYEVRALLEKKGAVLNIYDSWVTYENTVDTMEQALEDVKGVLIVTEHSDVIKHLKKMDLAASTIELIVDGRNSLDADAIAQQGILYRGIGRRA